jgi:hypothetical protein
VLSRLPQRRILKNGFCEEGIQVQGSCNELCAIPNPFIFWPRQCQFDLSKEHIASITNHWMYDAEALDIPRSYSRLFRIFVCLWWEITAIGWRTGACYGYELARWSLWYAIPTFEKIHIMFSYTAIDTCYLLRYVEKNGRSWSSNPWSIRRTGVYHRFCPKTKSSVFIFLHPKEQTKLQERIRSLCTRGESSMPWANPMRFHLLLLSSYLDNWRWYLSDLGRDFLKTVST